MCSQSSSGASPGIQNLADDPRYHRFFELFNQGKYFEAHEVLEELWLPLRGTPTADYFKGLIQLAGAFVHERKERVQPAIALLHLAEKNLSRYRPEMLGIELRPVLELIAQWEGALCGHPMPGNIPRPCLRRPGGEK